jgi:hypothetical protein
MLIQVPRIWAVTRLMFISVMALCSTLTTSAQQPIRSQTNSLDVQLSRSAGNEPKPEDPTRAILAAFDKYEVVGMDAAHGNKDLDDLILRLLREPSFPRKVDDIVVECGNSLYQSVLDRYIAGGEVKLSEVRPVWRNTTQPMCSVSGFYEMLFPLIRRINQRLSPEKKLRVLAGDSPLDWSKVKEQSEVMLDRDANIASVMEKEVLSKHRKALMLFGEFHLFHENKTATTGTGIGGATLRSPLSGNDHGYWDIHDLRHLDRPAEGGRTRNPHGILAGSIARTKPQRHLAHAHEPLFLLENGRCVSLPWSFRLVVGGTETCRDFFE